jgi:hypothetical protein
MRQTQQQQRQQTTAATSKRPPIHQMTDEELRTWIRTTRAALQKKLARERAYLARRAARGTHTPTDDAYAADQPLLADLIALLDEMEASLAGGAADAD